MRTEFEFYSPIRIVTGIGESQKLDKWVKHFQASLVLVIADGVVAKTDAFLDMIRSMKEQGIAFEVFSDTIPEPPMELIDGLAAQVREKTYDLIIAVGGGSPMDTAKAVCMLKYNEGRIKDYLFGGTKTPVHPSVPLICIPTTAGSGSEVSCASVIEDTEDHIKLSCTHPNLYAKVAILDPLMQKGMPAMVTAGTGMDAMTHAIESYTSKNSSVFTEMYARKAIEIKKMHPEVDLAVGFHPENANETTDEGLNALEELLKTGQFCVLGEIGLDYYWVSDNKEKQKELFMKQIDLANKYDLPISIHMRDATQDTYQILKEHPCHRAGIMHCYSSSYEMAVEFMKLGYYISLGGPVTFKNSVTPKEVAAKVPLDRLLTETDCPYMTPVPFRGKRNEPMYVTYTADTIAELRNISKEELKGAVMENYKRLIHQN